MNEVELRDWEHFKEYMAFNYGGKTGFIFRGHAERSCKLENTLTRLGQKVSADLKAEQLENEQLRNFKMKIRGMRGANPVPLTDNELWSLGQHFGLCTPLLDWTESPYIAAYFAFESSNPCETEWRTIFALNRKELVEIEKELAVDGFEFIESLQDDNSRIIAQAGLFTKIPTNTDLETWLRDKGIEHVLTKIHIEDYRLDVINDLKLMNIIGSTIYPDLHGASIACNMMIETLSENHELIKTTRADLEVIKGLIHDSINTPRGSHRFD